MNKTLSYGNWMIGTWYSACGLVWFPRELKESVDKGEVAFHEFWERFICPICRDCLEYDEAE